MFHLRHWQCYMQGTENAVLLIIHPSISLGHTAITDHSQGKMAMLQNYPLSWQYRPCETDVTDVSG